MFWCAIERDVIDVTGSDALTYLQSQVSQDLQPLADGARVWSFVLQPAGKVDALVRVHRIGPEHVRVDVDHGFGDVVLARLARFKIRVAADLALRTVPCVSVRGGDAPVDLLDDQAVPPPGVPQGSPADLELARIDAVWPAMGAEIVPGETIPAETGITDVAVSFTKGCYPGQELVERMDSRGASAPRLLQRVTVPVGTKPGDVLPDGSGVVTSIQGTAALALVKRSALPLSR
jgi:tRNA-modifying protein YgfZ